MKKITQSITILAVVAILVFGTACANNKNFNTDNPTENPQSNNIGMLPSEVVDSYMHFTLGSISNAEVDYDKAKKYLTDDLKAQFTSHMFVPTSYCIQDGPDDVRIDSDKVAGSTIEVVVEGQYGGEWGKMWQFSLIPDKPNMSWLISEIKCLNI